MSDGQAAVSPTPDELDWATQQTVALVEDLAYCGDRMADLLDEIGRTVSLPAHTREVLIRRTEKWRTVTGGARHE